MVTVVTVVPGDTSQMNDQMQNRNLQERQTTMTILVVRAEVCSGCGPWALVSSAIDYPD